MKKLIKSHSCLITLLLLTLSISVNGKNNLPVSVDNLYFYSSSYSPGEIYNPGPANKVSLSEVADEIVIKKKVDTTKERIEGLVNNLLPTAQICWITEDVCTVTADSEAIFSQKSVLLAESDIVSLRPAYIRTIYNDLMELYPVKQVALYGFTDTLFVWQRNENDDDEVDDLIASLGFQFKSDPKTPGRLRSHTIFVSKEEDILEIANNLFESGYFQFSEPRKRTIVRTIESDPLDMSQYDYYYNYADKTYLYKTPGRFMVKKENDIDKSVIESLIDRYLPEASITWKNDNICHVDTYESLVDQAIISLRNENSVVCANRCYMKKGDYEYMLLNGTGYPSDFSYDEIILLQFKDNVSASTIDSLKNKYNITSIEEPVDWFYTWAVPKTADYLATCNGLYESGYLSWIEPNWVTGYQVIFWNSTDTQTTSIEKPLSTKTGEYYYDLLGRRIESPSGLTIVVTRYSDGSIKTEKRLFR